MMRFEEPRERHVPLAVIAGPPGARVWPAITILLAATAMVAPANLRWDGAGIVMLLISNLFEISDSKNIDSHGA